MFSETQSKKALALHKFLALRVFCFALELLLILVLSYLTAFFLSYIEMTALSATQILFGFMPLFSDTGAMAGFLVLNVMMIFFIVRFFDCRNLLGFLGMNKFRLVDKHGNPISQKLRLLRCFAAIPSAFFFQVNLCLMAAGSRRLAHDYLSWTYVLFDDEDPRTCFYPPLPILWKCLVVVASVLTFTYYGNIAVYLDDLSGMVNSSSAGGSGPVSQAYRVVRCLVGSFHERTSK